MEPPNLNNDDFIYCKYTSDGQYTVSFAYKALITEQAIIDANVPTRFWRQLLKLKLHPCRKLFIWKLMHNALPTKELLLNKGLQLSPQCVLCKRHPETADHMFRHSEVAQLIWKTGDLGLHPSMNQHIALQRWVPDYISCLQKNDRHRYEFSSTVFYSTLWAIWLARNDIEFRKMNVTPHQILNLITWRTINGWMEKARIDDMVGS
ncbi:uncharacterized protein LOC141641608 [Silene latifolia]|uniref:uncharacterized protein LOC141641608 n=1 Tax=Silene latifolia TaxID=37657 RepID=UPI003D782725